MHMMRSSLSSHACTPAHCGCMTSQARISIRWPGMLRQVARSSRLLSLCQAAASSRLGPSVVAEPSVGPDLTARAFGALSQPFAMCDVSKAPPKQHTPLASKPAAAARSALAQDAKKRAYTTVDEDGAFGGVLYPEPIAKIGKPAPSFTAEAALDGDITTVSLEDYKGKYVILFFYPKDFTFVCPTEIIAFSDRSDEFNDLNCQVIGASTDTPEVHLAWIKTPRNKGGLGHIKIPILADVKKEIAAQYGCLSEDDGVAFRGTYLINPEGILEHITVNNMGIGRNIDETKRVLQAVQFVAEHGEVCPAGWNPGSKSMKGDHVGAQEYFSSLDKEEPQQEDFGAMIRTVKDKSTLQQVINGSKPAMVEFYAPWCGKCRQIAPFVEELQEKYPGVAFVKADTTADGIEPLTQEFNVKILPTFKFFANGKEVVEPISGYKKGPLEDAIKQLAK